MPFSTLALDLHNTIYDETLEYGPAIDEAVSVWLGTVPSLKREVLYGELSEAHRKLGSDWDDDVWTLLPSLKKLSKKDFHHLFAQAVRSRSRKSRERTLDGFYPGVRQTLQALKKRGVRIYVVTEAAANAGIEGIRWLKLGGLVDGMYSYPSRKAPRALTGTYHKPFPPGSRGHLRKPHPFLLAAVALDEAIHTGDIPAGTEVKDVFAVKRDDALIIAELPEDAPVQQDVTARLIVKKTPYSAALMRTLEGMLYVGDSKFRDGMLARNAGVAFGFAAYGKKGQDSPAARKGLEVMYAVTGWDKGVMKLTQEAGRSQAVQRLKPEFTFEKSLSEALSLF